MKTFAKDLLIISSVLFATTSCATAANEQHKKTPNENMGYNLVYLTDCSNLFYKIGEEQKGDRAKQFKDTAISRLDPKKVNLSEFKKGAAEAQMDWNSVKSNDDPHKQYNRILLCNYMYNTIGIDELYEDAKNEK